MCRRMGWIYFVSHNKVRLLVGVKTPSLHLASLPLESPGDVSPLGMRE